MSLNKKCVCFETKRRSDLSSVGKAEQYYLKTLEIDPDFGAAKRRLELLYENKKKK